MSNSTARDGDVSRLHPIIREKVENIRKTLNDEGHQFEVFEAFRTPERQRKLFAQGRTAPGNKVTWVDAWGSIHQYGLAVDFVLKENGHWSWKTSGGYMEKWLRMHEVAAEHGMFPLRSKKTGNLIELPHIQPEGISASALKRGEYPQGGDEIWAEHLSSLIDNWSEGETPSKPANAPQLPVLDHDAVAEMEEEAGTANATTGSGAVSVAAIMDSRFQRLHSFIKLWEGGFSNNPEDNGGATNMGITQRTLADWRKIDVTVDDVRNLTRDEADEIFHANYYRHCRCGELPERTAMAVYNGAVLHGPRRSIRFLQTAFNNLGMTADGKKLELDGILGPKTMAAAKQTDAQALSDAYMDVQEAVFRAHEDFDTFGNGWLNRQGALREFIEKLPKGAGKRPKKVMKISDRFDLEKEDLLRIALAAATGGKAQIGFYDPGVGTLSNSGPWSRLKNRAKGVFGLATGNGLDANVLDAYRFLIRHYQDGDDIYLFGFSRGAHTIRVLAGLMNMIGVLQPHQEHLSSYALTAYKQSSSKDQFDIAWRVQEVLDTQRVTIRFMGCWDTVASVIVPRPDRLYLPSLEALPFTSTNPCVQVFRQACAIDERRRMFRLSRWDEPQPFKTNPFVKPEDADEQDIRQVWFAGVHADIGGGYPESESGPAKYPLEWMVNEARDHGLEFRETMVKRLVQGQTPSHIPAGSKRDYVEPSVEAPLHNSMTFSWIPLEFLPKKLKWHDNPDKKKKSGFYFPLMERRDIPENSIIHSSVFARHKFDPRYDPPNLPSGWQDRVQDD